MSTRSEVEHITIIPNSCLKLNGEQYNAEIKDNAGNVIFVVEPREDGGYNYYNSYGEYVDAVVTTFEKSKMAYTLVYTDKAKDMKIDTRPYKEFIDGIKFIDPRKDVSKEIVDNFIAAEKSKENATVRNKRSDSI